MTHPAANRGKGDKELLQGVVIIDKQSHEQKGGAVLAGWADLGTCAEREKVRLSLATEFNTDSMNITDLPGKWVDVQEAEKRRTHGEAENRGEEDRMPAKRQSGLSIGGTRSTESLARDIVRIRTI